MKLNDVGPFGALWMIYCILPKVEISSRMPKNPGYRLTSNEIRRSQTLMGEGLTSSRFVLIGNSSLIGLLIGNSSSVGLLIGNSSLIGLLIGNSSLIGF